MGRVDSLDFFFSPESFGVDMLKTAGPMICVWLYFLERAIILVVGLSCEMLQDTGE